MNTSAIIHNAVAPIVASFGEWREEDHPRGQPENAGEFRDKHAAKFRKAADSLQKTIDEKNRPRTQNATPKRDREYRSRITEATILQRVQRAYRAMADARESGTLPAELENVHTRDEVRKLISKKMTTRGGYYDNYYETDEYSDTSPAGKALQALLEKKTPEQQAADAARRKLQEIHDLEAPLRYANIPGFFPTPAPVIERMMAEAGINSDHRVLEPSAGKGDIADAIKSAGAKPTVIEYSHSLAAILKAKGYEPIIEDFLQHRGEYDRIVMNPPFEGGQDIDHVRHAYGQLAPGGRVVAVMSEGPFFRTDKKSVEFRDWLDEQGGTSERLPAGSFTGPQAFRQTGTATRLVVLDKSPAPTERIPASIPSANAQAKTSGDPELEKILDMVRQRRRLEIVLNGMPKDGIPGSAAARAWQKRAADLREKISELNDKIGKRPDWWKPRPKTAADAKIARKFKDGTAATHKMFSADDDVGMVYCAKTLYRIMRDHRIMMFEGDNDGGRWITIGSKPGADGKKHGGSPVHIQVDGTIDKGPSEVAGQHISKLTGPTAALKLKMARKSGQASGLSEEEERHGGEWERFHHAKVEHVRSQLKDGRGTIQTNDPRMQVLVSKNIGPTKDRAPWRATYFLDGRPTSHQEYTHLDNPQVSHMNSLVHDVANSGVAFPVDKWPEISPNNPFLTDEVQRQGQWKQQQQQQQAVKQQTDALAARKQNEPSAADYPTGRTADAPAHPKPKREAVIEDVNRARQEAGDAPIDIQQRPPRIDSTEALHARIKALKEGGMRTDLAVAKARKEQAKAAQPQAQEQQSPPPGAVGTTTTPEPAAPPQTPPNVNDVPQQYAHVRDRMKPGDVWDAQANQVGRRISRLMRDNPNLSFADAKKDAVGVARGLGIAPPPAQAPPVDNNRQMGLFQPGEIGEKGGQMDLFSRGKPVQAAPAPASEERIGSKSATDPKHSGQLFQPSATQPPPPPEGGAGASDPPPAQSQTAQVPKDKPINLVFGGSFSPIHNGHIQAAKEAKAQAERQGYKVGKVIIAPTADKLLRDKLGENLIPHADRVKMAELAAKDHPELEVAAEPGQQAEKFEGKLRRTQLADWARQKYPDSTVVAVAGQDSAPGSPPAPDALYTGDEGTNHAGYHYMSVPRDTDKPDAISSSKVRKHYAEHGTVPESMMHPEAAKHYDEHMKARKVAAKPSLVSQMAETNSNALGGREPHEVTREEYETALGKPKSNTTITGGSNPHEEAVKTAITQGKPVSDKVLQDYPHLSPGARNQPAGAATAKPKKSKTDSPEDAFYKKYPYQHTLLRDASEDTINKLVNEGFQGGIGPNVVGATRHAPMDIMEQRYGTKAGSTVVAIPHDAIESTPNGNRVKQGYKPTREQFVKINRDYEPLHEAHARSNAPQSAPDDVAGKMAEIQQTLDKARAGQATEPAEQHALEPTSTGTSTGTGEAPEPGTVTNLPVEHLHVDPERFQYKGNTDKSGVTNKLKNVKYDSELSGILSVWHDPSDGKTYVVNGHHRHELAKRSGVPSVAVRYLKAKTPQEARTTGALINIAQGNGRGVDAAKLFRESGLTAEDLKERGVSLSHGLATTGLNLAKLHPDLFRHVVNGNISEPRGAAIAAAFDDHAQQKALHDMLDRQEKRGRAVSNDEISDLARFIRSAGVREESGGGLFGDDVIRKSNAMEKARLSSWYKKQIRRDKKLFGTISRKRNLESLTEAGNKIDAERAGKIADESATAEYVFDKLVDRKGSISDHLNQHAERLAKGESYESVSKSLAAALRDAIPAALGGNAAVDTGSQGASAGRIEGDSGGPTASGSDAGEQPDRPDPNQVKMFSADRRIGSLAQLVSRMREVAYAN